MRLFKHAKVYPITFITPKEIFLKDECVICLEELQSFSALPCGHCFHSKCISDWISKNMSCPECRVKLRFKKS